jgi:hypothetical protein
LSLRRIAFPKPRRTGKLRKPIARKKRPARVRKTSRGKMTRQADKLFSLIVRSRGKCEWHAVGGACAGPLQCAHGIGRTYRSVRWDERNAFALCAGAHVWTTHHPLEWHQFMHNEMGGAALEALKAKALKPWDGDLSGVLVRLAARAVALGIEPS